MKKLISSILLTMALVLSFFPVVIHAETSATAPKITSVALDTTSAKQGDTVNATVSVTRPTALGISLIELNFYNPTLNINIVGRVQFDPYNFSDTITVPVIIDNTQASGNYILYSANIKNQSGETRSYYYTENNGTVTMNDNNATNESFSTVPSITVAVDPNADTVAPVLTNVKLLNTTAMKGDTISIQYTLVEEETGLKNISISFDSETNTGTEKILSTYANYTRAPLKSGTYTITMKIPTDIETGVYKIAQIDLLDNYNNSKIYSSIDSSVNPIETEGAKELTVTSDGDETKPVATGLKIITDQLTRPGMATISVDTQDVGYGIKAIDATFVTENLEFLDFHYYSNKRASEMTDSKNTYTIQQRVDDNTPIGDYVLDSLTVTDQSGNSTTYSKRNRNLSSLGTSNTISVINEISDVAETALSNPDLVSFVKQQPNSAIIKIAADTKIAPKELFECIVGTNKTINIYKKGISWVFKAIDIVPSQITKDIDVSVKMTSMSDELNPTADNVVQLIFPDNGVLPGIVTMRLKADYLSYLYNIKKGLMLYFENNNSLTQESTKFSMASDGYLEFTLTHNSTYFISNHAMTAAPSPIDPSLVLSNTDLSKDIAQLEDNAVIDVKADTNTVSKDVFDSLVGTNKILQIHQDNVDWVFNGKDITESLSKDIDLGLTITVVDGAKYQSNDKVILLSFPENGTLPGPAKIRIKNDEMTALYEAGKELVLYYQNNDGSYTKMDSPVTHCSDGYFEITLTHNSTYVIRTVENNNTAGNTASSNADTYVAPDTAVHDYSKGYLFCLLLSILIAVTSGYVLIKKSK